MRADPTSPDVLDIAAAAQMPFLINYGSADAVSARLVCGYLACDARPFNPLNRSLAAGDQGRLS